MDVELYVYDLSRGLARNMSAALIGVQLDAIYHTSIVFEGVEYGKSFRSKPLVGLRHPDINSLRRRHSVGHTRNDPSRQTDANIKIRTYLIADGHHHGLSGINETNIHCRSMNFSTLYST
jgi:hypothetical protein